MQSLLQDPAHEPLQVLPPVQVSEQEPPVIEQPVAWLPCQVQLPLWQVQAEPLQAQLGPGQAPPAEALSQPDSNKTASKVR